MKLYSVDRSPFAARVRTVAYLKGLDLPTTYPADGLAGPEFQAVNPIGKLPVLILDDGQAIPESEVIVEYLEHAYPEPSVLPSDAAGRAQARFIARVAEIYIMAPLFQLFTQMNPAARDQAAVDASFAAMDSGLKHLERILGAGAFAYGDTHTVADAMVTPTLFWCQLMYGRFGRTMPSTPKLEAYAARAQKDAVLGKIWREMADDMAALAAAAAAAKAD